MTDKEFKRLNRAQLLDIIYHLQLQVEKLDEEKQALEAELADKRFRLSAAGNIAEASLEMNDCFRSAQRAAEQYLNEIKAIREEADAERERILAKARAEADAIVADAKNKPNDYDALIEAIVTEYEQRRSDNG